MSYEITYYAVSFFLAGILSGIASEFLSIGSVMRVPMFIFLFSYFGCDFSIATHLAIGTTLAVSVPASIVSIVSMRKFLMGYCASDAKDRSIIYRFLKGWVPWQFIGTVLGLVLLQYTNSGFLVAIYLFMVAVIALQMFVLRDELEIIYRFSGSTMKIVVALISGIISLLSGLPSISTRSILRACTYYFESGYAAAVGGLVISITGTAGFVLSGLEITDKPNTSIGYVDIIAAVAATSGSFLFYWFALKIGLSQKIKQFKEQITSNRSIDTHTGLYRFSFFYDRLSYLILYANRFSEPVSLLMIDMDNMSSINKKIGEKNGKRVLSLTGRLLLRSVREIDIPATYSNDGDEFVVILPRTDKRDSIAVAESIRNRIASAFLLLNDANIVVSVSIGISTFPQSATDKDLLIKRAEEAMHYSKRTGKNRSTHYDDIALDETVD